MRFLYYYIQSIEKLNKIPQLKELLKQVNVDKSKNPELWLLVRHFRYKYLANKEDQLRYLRNEILGFKHLTDEVNVLYYMMMDAFKLFQKHHFYKEATQIINKYLPMIKQLNEQ
jgi:hypothetical protein